VSDTGGSRTSLSTVFGFAAAMDLLGGVVLAVIGVSQDLPELTVVGVLLLLAGAAVATYVLVQKNRPQAL
jgi:hypothetical protein